MHGEYQTEDHICNGDHEEVPEGTSLQAIFSNCCLFKCKMFNGKKDLCDKYGADPEYYHRCKYDETKDICEDVFDYGYDEPPYYNDPGDSWDGNYPDYPGDGGDLSTHMPIEDPDNGGGD